MSGTLQASRVDTTSGVREVAEFVGTGDAAIFSFTHLPADAPKAGVVICSPVYAEFIRNYRREVLIGRKLAERGIAVQRFHYRGQGNSGGDESDTSFESMVEDATAAHDHLRSVADARRIGFFGSRFGALIAASVASSDPRSPVAFWDPVVEAPGYFRDIYRARQMQALKGGATADGSGTLADELAATGSAPVLGYTITQRLFETSQDRSLEDALGADPRQVLILQMGRDARSEKQMAPLIERWRAAGHAVDEHVGARREAWWFTSGAAASKEDVTEAVDATVGWMARALAHEVRSI